MLPSPLSSEEHHSQPGEGFASKVGERQDVSEVPLAVRTWAKSAVQLLIPEVTQVYCHLQNLAALLLEMRKARRLPLQLPRPQDSLKQFHPRLPFNFTLKHAFYQ